MFDNSHSTFQSPVHSSPEDDRLEVNIELVSNWGHPDLIGLTELQFFNEKRQQIKVPRKIYLYTGIKVTPVA